MNLSRRDFVKMAGAIPFAAGLAGAQSRNKSYVDGVQLGVQTYSFHEIPNDGQNHADWIIKDMLACGLYDCELFGCQIEPGTLTGTRPSPADCPNPLVGCTSGKGGSSRNPWAWEFDLLAGDDFKKARAAQRKWRETVSMDYFANVRKQFAAAGINIFSYNPLFAFEKHGDEYVFTSDTTDLEIDRVFLAAKTLGAKAVNVSTVYSEIKRMVPFAEKHEIIVAPHGHSVTWNPDEFSTRATFVRAFALSKWVGANLDIGHYTAAGGDPVAFINEFHSRITNLHLKDRKRNHTPHEEDGENVPWGEGDTPIKAVLHLLRDKKYSIPAFIEYEHAGTQEPVAEVKKCYQYCLDALQAS